MMILVILAAVVGYLFYKYAYRPTQYWKERNIVQIEPAWPIFGNVGLDMILRRKPFYELVKENYNRFADKRYVNSAFNPFVAE